jgi:hypothetical protein
MFSAASLAVARKEAERARAQIRKRASTEPKPTSPMITTLETVATAGAFGAADGARGTDGGASALVAGVAFHAIAFLCGSDGGLAEHSRALGDGALAACAYRNGFTAGAHAAQATHAAPARPPTVHVIPREPRPSRTLEITIARFRVTSSP